MTYDDDLFDAPEPIAAELAVLGALLLEPQRADHAATILEGRDFHQPRHETIWHAIHDVQGAGILPDPVTVAKRLTDRGDITRVGGAMYLHDLMAACPFPANLEGYAMEVRDRSRLRRIETSALKLRQLAQDNRGRNVDDVLVEALAELQAATAGVAPSKLIDFDSEFLSRDQLDTLPAPEPLITGVLTRHAYGILRGRDDSFKSFVALDWGLCLATGRSWQGHNAQTVRVLYIAGEGAYGLAARVAAWEQAWGTTVPAGMLTIRATALNMFKPGPAFDHLLDHIETGGYGLVIIDTLRRVAGAADGNSSEMGAVVDNIDRLKRATTNGSVLVVAHTDKGDNDSRGYSGIEDDADVVWHAKREDMNLHLENTKMKDGPGGKIHQLHASVVGPSLVLEEAGITIPVATESQIKLLDTLRQVFPDGAHSTKLQAASGLAESTFYRVLAQLKAAGHIVNTGTSKRAFYELATPTNSHDFPPANTPAKTGNSHDLSSTPTTTATTPLTPTALLGGSERGNGPDTKNRQAS